MVVNCEYPCGMLHGRVQRGTVDPDPLPGKSQVGIGFLKILERTPSRSNWTLGPLLLEGGPYGPL